MRCLFVTSLVICISVLTGGISQAFTLESEIDLINKKPVVRPEFPVPDDENVLFYIQRSTNSNTIVYAARVTPAGRFEGESPVQAYWRRFNTTGERKALNYIEENFAFGIVTSKLPDNDNQIEVHLTSLPSRRATVRINTRKQVIATIKMGVYDVRLLYAYIAVDESSILPWVHYVDVFGVDLKSGKYVRERIRPVDKPKSGPTAH